MRFGFPFLDVLVLPTGATSGRRIVLDGINGVIQLYRADDTLAIQLGGAGIFEDALTFWTGDPAEDFPAFISSSVTGAGATRNLVFSFVAPTFVGATDFPFTSIVSRSQNNTTDDPVFNIDADGGQGRLHIPSQIGSATLVAGTVPVARTSIDALSRIFLSRRTPGGTVGNLSYVLNPGVGFTINSDNAADTSLVDWLHLND